MEATILTPTKAIINNYEQAEVDAIRKHLSYKDKSSLYQLSQLKTKKWFKENHPEKYQDRLNEIMSTLNHCLLKFDGYNYFITPSQIFHIQKKFNINVKQNNIVYPKLNPFQWKVPFPYTPYIDQEISVSKLIEHKHANVELCTGLGKTFILLKTTSELGLKTIIITPSLSIHQSVLKDAIKYFGEDKVGSFSGKGKKDLSKLVTVAVSKSVSNIKPNSAEMRKIKQMKCVLFDEAHTLPATTLETMCNDILNEIPYRIFVSGTMTDPYDGIQINNLCGPCVHRISTREGIAKGYIGDLNFNIVNILTHQPSFDVQDKMKMKRVHLYQNTNILNWSANLANGMWNVKKESTLILVKDIEQIAMLNKKIQVPMNYIHGNTISKAELDRMNLRKIDLEEELYNFNMGKTKVLIGTDSISTGTNIYPTHNVINWQGGSSEIPTRQGIIGRSVRKLEESEFASYHKPKENSASRCWDFNIKGISMLERHLNDRIKLYKDTTDNIRYI